MPKVWIAVLVIVPVLAITAGVYMVSRPRVPHVQPVAGLGLPTPTPVAKAASSPLSTVAPTAPAGLTTEELRQQLAEQRAEAERLRAAMAEAERAKAAIATARHIRGSAWLSRNNGASDLLRGLDIYLLPERLSDSVAKKVYLAASESWKAPADDERAASKTYRDLVKQYPDLGDMTRENQEAAESHEKQASDYDALALAVKRLAFAGSQKMNAIDLYRSAVSSGHGCPYFVPADDEHVGQAVHTDTDGNFDMSDVKPGKYYIHARLDTPTMFVEWLESVTVDGSADIKLELYNKNSILIKN